jgi:NTE family protein
VDGVVSTIKHPHAPVPINLALQGGGAHGAFTWGVLDRLLEDGRLSFSAISGTSAGAMNAVALADGWQRGEGGDPRESARERLSAFWHAVGQKGRFSPIQRTPLDVLTGNFNMEANPALLWFEAVSRTVSPRMANPFNINPLRDVVEAEIDFARIAACKAMELFISATHVETGRGRVFRNHELTADHVMASACLPTMFPAVEIEGEHYWDGGFAGNPALYPFFYENAVEDVLLVQINPILRPHVPESARDIADRINEVTFNAGLLAELRAIAFVKKLIGQGRLSAQEYRDIRMHRIDADDALSSLSSASKLLAEPTFLLHLRDLGRAAAEDWLDAGVEHVGVGSGIDLSDMLSAGMRAPLSPLGPRVNRMMAQRPFPHAASRG